MATSPTLPASTKPYGTTTFLDPTGLLWFGTVALEFTSVYSKDAVDSLIAGIGGNLQSVTTGTGNNKTSNAIQVTGFDNVDLTQDGLTMFYQPGGSTITNVTGSAITSTLSLTTGTAAIGFSGLQFKVYNEETTENPLGVLDGRLSLLDAINPNEAVTLGQITTSLGSFVPYIGATSNVNLGSHSLLFQNIDPGNGTYNNTVSPSEINLTYTPEGGANSAQAALSAEAGLYLKTRTDIATGQASLRSDLLTVNRNFQFPNADGTLALTSNLSSYVPYTGATGNVNLGSNNITSNSFIKSGGTSSQFLKADGSVDGNTYQNTSQKNQANGYAGLDSGVKIFLSQLPDSILGALIYQGTWNATTNSPTLANPPSSDTKGYYYVTNTAGTQFGITFAVGDWIVSNGTEWQKVDNSDAVTTVFGRLGNVVANESDYSSFYPLLNGTGATGTWGINISGNAETVTNGVYTTGSYADPSWITSLAYSKLTGAPNLSGYELLANKQNSLATDGTGVKYPTVDAVNKRTPFVTPEEFGAVGDGVTDDAAAIQAALNTGDPVILAAKTYRVSTSILVGNKNRLTGLGEKSLLTADGNYPAIKMVGSDAQISNIGLIGSNDTSPEFSNNHGILIDGTDGMISYLMLDNIFINGFGGSGIRIYDNRPPYYRPSVIANSITASNSSVGFEFGESAEYSIFSNCVANENKIGVKISGGNNSFNGGSIVSNTVGVFLTGGSNNTHSVMTGTMINHNTDYSIQADGATFGYLFNACMIYYGDIFFKDSNLMKITNSDLHTPSFYTQTSDVELLSNKWLITPNFELEYLGTTSTVRFFDNNFVAGGQPSYIQSELKEQLTIHIAPTKPTDVVRLTDLSGYVNTTGNQNNIAGVKEWLDNQFLAADKGYFTTESGGSSVNMWLGKLTSEHTDGRAAQYAYDGMYLKTNATGAVALLKSDNVLSTQKNFQLPNASGTLALTSDLANYVNTTGSQIGIAGNKQWLGDQVISTPGSGFYAENGTGGTAFMVSAVFQSVPGGTSPKNFTASFDLGIILNTGTTSGGDATLRADNLTTGRTFQFPNAAGTLALIPDVSVTSTSLYTIPTTNSSYNTFSGTTSTWTLPTIASNSGKRVVIINRGSGNITLNSNAGASDIDESGVYSAIIVVPPATTLVLVNNSLKWVIVN